MQTTKSLIAERGCKTARILLSKLRPAQCGIESSLFHHVEERLFFPMKSLGFRRTGFQPVHLPVLRAPFGYSFG